MPKLPLCILGITVKRRLDDLNETQNWLIEEVRKDTGLYFDNGYMQKILTGKRASSRIITSICKILEIENPNVKAS